MNSHAVIDTLNNTVVMRGTKEQCSEYIIKSTNPFLTLSIVAV